MSIFFALQDFISVENYLYLHYFAVIKLDHSLATYRITLLKRKKTVRLIVFFLNFQFLKTHLIIVPILQSGMLTRPKYDENEKEKLNEDKNENETKNKFRERDQKP